MCVSRGDPDKVDLKGFSSLHHSCNNGHINVASYLINFGCNIWAMDNDYKTAQDIAALCDKTEIVKLLDEAKAQQQVLNPGNVKKLSTKAFEEADRNRKRQEKHAKVAQRIAEKEDYRRLQYSDPDFKPSTKEGVFRTLTKKFKTNNRKYGGSISAAQNFSDIAIGNKSKGTRRKIFQKQNGLDSHSGMDFKVSDVDSDGIRTVRSVLGSSGYRKNSDVMYLTNTTDSKSETASGSRPALSNVFSLQPVRSNKWKSESDLIDSGTGSIDSTGNDDEDESPGMFKNTLGKLSFLHTRQGITGTLNGFAKAASVDYLDEIDGVEEKPDGARESKRNSTGSDSIGTTTSLEERVQGDVPWKDEDLVLSDDDEEDQSEYSPLVRFLESCGLTNYTHIFTNEDTDLEALMLLTDDDFKRLNFRLGPQRKIQEAIRIRKEALSSLSPMMDTHL